MASPSREKSTVLIADDLAASTSGDRSRSVAIRQFAAAFSTITKDPVDFLYTQKLSGFFGLRKHQAKVATQALEERFSSQQEKIMKDFPLPGKFTLTVGHPVKEILHQLRSHRQQKALILGTSLRMGLDYLMLGSVAEEVLRQCRRPVFILGPQAQKNQSYAAQLIQDHGQKRLRFLVSTDLSAKSRALETYALSLAKKLQAEVLLYHCISESIQGFKETAYTSDFSENSLDQFVEELTHLARQGLLKRISQFRKNGVACDFDIESEVLPVSKSILKKSKDCHFIFMGTQTHNSTMAAMVGGTLREVLAQAKVPVVSVQYSL